MDVTSCNDSCVIFPPRGVKQEQEVDGKFKYYNLSIFLCLSLHDSDLTFYYYFITNQPLLADSIDNRPTAITGQDQTKCVFTITFAQEILIC